MLATPEGTARFAARFQAIPQGYWRSLRGLTVGSLGMGTYLGGEDDVSDAGYIQAATRALSLGCNLLDTAINYRHQRSERALGRALAEAFEHGKATRQEVVVCTKGGYVPFDRGWPPDPAAYVRATYVATGILRPGDLVDGVHAMGPSYLLDQLRRSLRNLQLQAVDVYYVHNPEHQLGALARDEVEGRLRDAFAALEGACDEGRVGSYGVATWNGLRVPPGHPEHLSLERLVALAREAHAQAGARGGGPRFGVVQAPLNLAMPEALTTPTQTLGGRRAPLLEAARALGVDVVASASLAQGRLARSLPGFVQHVLGLGSDAHRALQFARSAPGVTTALVGMGQAQHAEANLALAREPPAQPEDLRLLSEAAGRAR